MTQPNRKIALVTGGSRGIGRSTVLSLARRGVDIIFTYKSNQEEADKVISLIRDTGREAVALKLDAGAVGTFDSFVQDVGKTLQKLGAERFDYLVNNAASRITEPSRRPRRKSWTSCTKCTSRACSF